MEGWLALVDGDTDASLDFSREGYKIATALGSTDIQAMGLLAQGAALEKKACWEKAAEVYHQTLSLVENAG